MFASIKQPKNLVEYRLFRGAADFGNLQQWDLYETGYSFMTVVTVPKFITELAKSGGTVSVASGTAGAKTVDGVAYKVVLTADLVTRLLNNFVYIIEHEFRGISGLPDLTTETTTITDGISELKVINKVVEDSSVTVSMSFFEKSGRTLTKFSEVYLRGIKDSRTQGKSYFGLIERGLIPEPGFHNEVFSFLYYVTDNTYRNLEGAYLLMCAQIESVPLSDLFNTQKGTYQNPEVELRFNCFPISNDDVSNAAKVILEYILSPEAGEERLIIDAQSTSGFYKGVADLATPYGLQATSSGYGGQGGDAIGDNKTDLKSKLRQAGVPNKYLGN